ncbi:MAG: hypothetical protein CM15mV3_0420 [Caudoviricetes sp.]|nr:MAG: hypothetical protein CM15mV3_0420 [Caudoviricetes sp.]
MTFDNAETTLDNTQADRTFLHSSKQYFDLGLSGGLSVDPVLRLDNKVMFISTPHLVQATLLELKFLMEILRSLNLRTPRS